ncbi:hypothetical protein J0H58_34665 [bacterium]|nr:hypothetical protein [bacterium]
MRYLLLIFPAFAALTPAAATPIPADALAPPLFPTAVGTRWVYRDAPQEWSETITAAEKRSGATVITIEKKILKAGGPGVSTLKVEVSNRGVIRVEVNGQKDDIRHYWLKLPAEPGTEWRETWPQGSTVRTRVSNLERITVPAGTYQAIPVEAESKHPAEVVAIRTTSWYAPGVGLVKQDGGSYEILLTSFTPGR